MFKTLKFKQSVGYTVSAKRLSFVSVMSVLGFGFLASSFADTVDTAYVPFEVNAEAKVSALSNGAEVASIDVGAEVVQVLKIPLQPSSIRLRSKLNNTPFVSGARGKVSLNLPASSYQNADVALYAINGRAVMRGKVTASEAVKSISRSNVSTGVYLCPLRGLTVSRINWRFVYRYKRR